MTNGHGKEKKGSEIFFKVIGYFKLIKLVLVSALFYATRNGETSSKCATLSRPLEREPRVRDPRLLRRRTVKQMSCQS